MPSELKSHLQSRRAVYSILLFLLLIGGVIVYTPHVTTSVGSKPRLSDHFGKGSGLYSPELIYSINSEEENSSSPFSLEHELRLRRLQEDLRGLTSYVVSRSIQNGSLDETSDRLNVMRIDLDALSNTDGADAWRRSEHEKLQELMRRRIYFTQNPDDCSTARIVVCDIDNGCGLGCAVHHAAHCFITAHSHRRMFVLRSKGWVYSESGWEKYFLPLSDKCHDVTLSDDIPYWNGSADVSAHRILWMDSKVEGNRLGPNVIPDDLIERLLRVTDEALFWVHAQFIRYMFRLQPHIETLIEDRRRLLNYTNPIVSVHVRRTDKLREEAQRYDLDEYMERVNHWFRLQEKIKGRIDERRVYLATDDPTVITNASIRCPEYKFIFSHSAVTTSHNRWLGSMETGLFDAVADLYFLSHGDHFVGTFSSNIGRLAYELMLTTRHNATFNYDSLDARYHIGGKQSHNRIAVQAHIPLSNDEMVLEIGDWIRVRSLQRPGQGYGKNERTGQTGYYPTYKTVEKLRIAKFPTFTDSS